MCSIDKDSRAIVYEKVGAGAEKQIVPLVQCLQRRSLASEWKQSVPTIRRRTWQNNGFDRFSNAISGALLTYSMQPGMMCCTFPVEAHGWGVLSQMMVMVVMSVAFIIMVSWQRVDPRGFGVRFDCCGCCRRRPSYEKLNVRH